MKLHTAIWSLTVLLMLVASVPAHAQLNGHNLKGDYGLQAGSQPPPGAYLLTVFYNYNTSRVNDRFGSKFNPGGGLNATAGVVFLSVVTPWKILGANYAFDISPSFADSSIDAPILAPELDPRAGFSDLYVQPLVLGWHTKQADFLFGYGFIAPTGRYEPDALDNNGLGFWSNEFSLGTTIFFDGAKNWHLAALGAYEFHTKVKDADLEVGDILTVEGGFGRSLFEGAGSAGVTYYGQFKVTPDTGSDFPSDIVRGKHRVHALGPEFTFPIATKTRLIMLVTVRYQWEFGARTTSQGQALNLTLTFPLKMFGATN